MNPKLEKRIEEFLAERRESGSGGGWAKITDGDIGLLTNIINALIHEKCEPDADGDRPIEVEIVNRRTHQRMHYIPVPYDHLLGQREIALSEERLRVAMANLRIATGEVSTAYEILLMRKERK